MNYNFYIVNSDLSKLLSLKRILRRELHKSDLSGSVVIRNTINFIKSIKKTSENDVFIIDIDLLDQFEFLDKIYELNSVSSLIVLIDDDYDKTLVDQLISGKITKLIKIRDFSMDLIAEYIFHDIDELEIYNYIKNTNLKLSKDEEIQTLKIKSKNPFNFNEIEIKADAKDDFDHEGSRQMPMSARIKGYFSKKEGLNYRDANSRAITTAGKRHINIWGNYQFGCELAYMLAKKMSLKIILIDSNRLEPSLDMYFGIEKFSKSYEINDDESYNTGLNIAIDAIRKNLLTKDLLYDISKVHKKLKNLFFLSGSYNINNYEYYDSKSYIELINMCKDSFDVVITLSNDNIYDLYTSISIIKSDINAIPMEVHYDNIRKINKQISFLVEKQNISLEKNFVVPFEYMMGIDIGLDYLKDLSICKSLSKISFSKIRRSKRSLNKCFVENLDKKQEGEYKKLIKELGYS